MIDVSIDRKRWLRGEGGRVSSLLRPSDGKMCCMGFYCLVMGLSPEDICDIHSLGAIKDNQKFDVVIQEMLPILSQLYHTNDHPSISSADRETKLVELGHKADINFTFQGEEDQ